MRFNSRARLDTSRTRDVGGGRGGGRPGLGGGGIGVPHVAGGGLGVIILAIVIYIVQAQLGGSGGSALDASRLQSGGKAHIDYSVCKTGADANNNVNCALVAVENSLTDYWSQQPDLASRLQAAGSQFRPENDVVTFSGSVQTNGCGSATTDVGPFYCSGDGNIYLDEAFYSTVAKQLGIDPTGFVRAYVIAHEYGHHIQDLLGTMSRVHTSQGPTSDSVRLELQADCYAGMWARSAATTKDAQGVTLIEPLTRQDIQDAVTAAGDVGDDYIQRRMGGQVNSSQFTHGTSAERQAWFTAGYRDASGSLRACDTFSASDLSDPSTA
jgi:uncharacterized protein